MSDTPSCLAAAARSVLLTADPAEKCVRTRDVAFKWCAGAYSGPGLIDAPKRPARPARPELLSPSDVPRRRINQGEAGRIALLHALAHIELNAVDLAWDIVARFSGEDLPWDFFDDWVAVANDEARHFSMLAERLTAFGIAYGDLPAHDGLWDAAIQTRHDLAARLAIVPLVLEARGLDVTPVMIEKLRAAEDHTSADILEVIYREEIGHVRAGRRWFEYVCAQRGHEPETTWQSLVTTHFRGDLKPPFNADARTAAGMPQHWYEGLPPA